MRPFNISKTSGRWFFSSHWPKSSRTENTRSFARAFSSSLLAPPIHASNPCFSMACNKESVCNMFRLAYYHFLPVRFLHRYCLERNAHVIPVQVLQLAGHETLLFLENYVLCQYAIMEKEFLLDRRPFERA